MIENQPVPDCFVSYSPGTETVTDFTDPTVRVIAQRVEISNYVMPDRIIEMRKTPLLSDASDEYLITRHLKELLINPMMRDARHRTTAELMGKVEEVFSVVSASRLRRHELDEMETRGLLRERVIRQLVESAAIVTAQSIYYLWNTFQLVPPQEHELRGVTPAEWGVALLRDIHMYNARRS